MFLTKEKLRRRVRELESRRYSSIQSLFPFISMEDEGGPDMVRLSYPGKIEGPLLDRMDFFAGLDRYLWLQKEVVLPRTKEGSVLVGLFDFGKTGGGHNSGFESLLFINGEKRQGVDSNHNEILLEDLAGKQTEFTFLLWSGLEGSDIFHEKQYHQLRQAQLAWLNEDANELYYQARAVLETLDELEEDSETGQELLHLLNKAFFLLDWDTDRLYETVRLALSCLKSGLDKPGKNTQVTVHCIGHTHIDVAWLWRLKHTREKAVRSFATAVRLMDEFKNFKFLQSQPQLYEWIKEDAPDLYDKILEKIEKGVWEPEGGMWLEADCNIPSGESLARQFLYGCRFLKEEFGKSCTFLWLPDVFGYSWALPQILKLCGIKTFATTKISWNQYNRMPHDLFFWRGIDGSEILTYFLTTPRAGQDPKSYGATYNGYLKGETVNGSWKQFQDKEVSKDVLISYGYGDGGGGVTRDMIQIGEALDRVPGIPHVVFDNAGSFFNKLHENVNRTRSEGGYVHTWDGELYLELHRGTYTSQAANKKSNRKLEHALMQTEWLSVLSGKEQEAAEALRSAWKILLRNQFHDIIPGSSIHEVYEDSAVEYAKAFNILDELKKGFADKLTIAGENVWTIGNAGSFYREGIAVLPIYTTGNILDQNGKKLPVQRSEEGMLVRVGMEPLSLTEVHFVPETKACEEESPFAFYERERLLETPFFQASWDADGRMSSLIDKRCGRQVLEGKGNSLDVYEDKAVVFDAWDIDIFYKEKKERFMLTKGPVVTGQGAISVTLSFAYHYRKSDIRQDIIFYASSPRIDFRTHVDWREDHRLLKVSFPVQLRSTRASYEIQYGYLERPTHWNTSWDQAKFEVVGHAWADISEPDYGTALLNDCKYGYSVKDNVLELSLLKSSKNPDETADMGEHDFIYSLLPHENALADSDVFAQAEDLNCSLLVWEGKPWTDRNRICRVHADNVVVDAVKAAEDGDGIIVRIHECRGKREKGSITSDLKWSDFVECNLLEEPIGEVQPFLKEIPFSLRPFEIKTWRIHKQQ